MLARLWRKGYSYIQLVRKYISIAPIKKKYRDFSKDEIDTLYDPTIPLWESIQKHELFPASLWSSHGCYGHLGSELVDTRSTPVSVTLK